MDLAKVFYWTRDMDRAVAFYRDVLGLDVRLAAGGGWTEFATGGSTLALHGPVGGHAPEGAGATVVLECADLDATMAEWSERGVSFEGEITETPAGARFATFRDPDGNLLQLLQPGR